MSRRWAYLTFISAVILCLVGQIPRSAASDPVTGSRIRTAVEILAQVPTGKTLIEKGMKLWNLSSAEQLAADLRPGLTSRTDAVLTRHYNPLTGKESREREVTIYVREDQDLENVILDIAHEMVHATSRPSWDPYDPTLTAGRYIKSEIEGVGGEIQAVETECQVALELAAKFGMSTKRCGEYMNGSRKEIDPALIKADFYRVGKWDKEITQALGQETRLFPELSAAPPRLYSSTGNAPYPAALLREFRALTQIACRNSRRRIASDRGRSIASARDSALIFIQRRCQ